MFSAQFQVRLHLDTVPSFGPPIPERCQLNSVLVAETVKSVVGATARGMRDTYVQPREERSGGRSYCIPHSLKEATEQMELDSSQKWIMKAHKATNTKCCK